MRERRTWPNSESRLPTELALGSDGVVYIRAKVVAHEGRREFIGYSLHQAEIAELGVRKLLAWGVLGGLALGSDGRVYVAKGGIAPGGRQVFRGFAATDTERACIVEEFHRMAFNLTIAARCAARGPSPLCR